MNTSKPSEKYFEKISPRQIKRTPVRIWFLRLMIVAGFGTFFNYLSWWFSDGRLASPWIALLFCAAMLYAGLQIIGVWILYLFAENNSPPSSWPDGLTIDVFVTAYREPYDLIEKTLTSACAMRGVYRTWLLDDGADPYLASMAKRLGAGYLARQDHTNAKAGNVNAALEKTEADIVVVFDIDHVPGPDFLERSVGYFANPRIGFVQVMLTFSNSQESWVAKAAIETSLDFYNPTSLGAHGMGSATLMGSNALIRRTALESIGGYQPGLAEDLATSIALHAAGWQSAYVAEPLAPGLAPPSFFSWFIQQLKWSRGVFELLLTAYPRLFVRLSWGQRVTYAVRMTYYWVGPAVATHLLVTIAILIYGNYWVRAGYHQYLIHITPLLLAAAGIRYTALKLYRHHSVFNTSFVRASILVYATWPIYLLAWGMALLRLPLKFRPTPKRAEDGLSSLWLFPQVLAVLLIAIGTTYTIWIMGHPPSILLLYATGQGVMQLIFLTRWLISSPLSTNSKDQSTPAAPIGVIGIDSDRSYEEIKSLGDSINQSLIRYDKWMNE
jgi:cellulose synthase (UDP-forming)